MANEKHHTIDHPLLKLHHEHRADGLEVRNGLVKHTISNRQGSLVCVKLYANGWSITTGRGTVSESVSLDGTNVVVSPAGNIRKAQLVLSEYVPIAKPQRVEKVVVDSIHGLIEMRNDRDSLLEIFLDGQRIGSLKNPDKRNVEYDLPDTISLSDAAILYCMGMMAVRYDDVDIV